VPNHVNLIHSQHPSAAVAAFSGMPGGSVSERRLDHFPSGAINTNEQSTTAKSFLASFCTRCGGSNCSSVQATVEILPYLTDADLTELTSCAATACTLPEVLSACPNVANLQLFASCSLFTF
jgi:hypothetical protein